MVSRLNLGTNQVYYTPTSASTNIWPHKTFKYKFYTHASKLSNQNTVFIECNVLIGCFFSSMRTKLVLKHFMIMGPNLLSYFSWKLSCPCPDISFNKYQVYFLTLVTNKVVHAQTLASTRPGQLSYFRYKLSCPCPDIGFNKTWSTVLL